MQYVRPPVKDRMKLQWLLKLSVLPMPVLSSIWCLAILAGGAQELWERGLKPFLLNWEIPLLATTLSVAGLFGLRGLFRAISGGRDLRTMWYLIAGLAAYGFIVVSLAPLDPRIALRTGESLWKHFITAYFVYAPFLASMYWTGLIGINHFRAAQAPPA